MEEYICPICKKEFKRYRDKRGSVRLCSKQCQSLWSASSDNPASKKWFKKNHTVNVGRVVSEDTKKRLSVSHNKQGSNKFGEKSAHWKGGVCLEKGYILIHQPKHPHSRKGYVREHRLVMEKVLGRYLLPEEEVHHLNGIKTDNRPENLKLFANAREHTAYHHETKKSS